MSDAIRVAEATYISGFRYFTSLLKHGVAEARAGLLHLHSGAHVGGMNPSIVTDASGDFAALLDDAAEFHATTGSSAWCVTARQSDRDRISAPARERGFADPHDMPFMVLEDIPDPERPDGLEIAAVNDRDGIDLHFRLLAASFETELRLFEPVCDSGLLDPRLALFVAHLQDTAVACSVALFTPLPRPSVGVFNVGTLPAFRGRGIGRAMTSHAAAYGRAHWDCRVAALQASEAGYALYRSMGYREVTRWQSWAPPARPRATHAPT